MAWRPNQNMEPEGPEKSKTQERFDTPPPSTNSPNSEPNTVQLPVDTQHGKETTVNRSENVRRDTDDVEDFTISLMDIDNTILSHIEKLNISILSNGNLTPVSTIYGSPERWKSAQKDGFLKDRKGKIQTPLMMVKRNTLQRNDSLKIFNRYPKHLSMPFKRKYSPKNQYDRFSLCNNIQEPVHEVYNINLPDHFIITYEMMIWTDMIEQNNAVVERISYASEDYWGDKKRFKFRTNIQDFNLQTEVVDGEDRVVRTNITMQVYAYLLPEYQKEWEKTIRKSFTPRRVVFGVELESDELGRFPTKDNHTGYTGQGFYNNNTDLENVNTFGEEVPPTETFLRFDGESYILRPDGISVYKQFPKII